MLSGFVLSIAAFSFCVLLPGYVLFRTLGIGRLVSLACAPNVVILLLVALGVLYAALGVPASPALMFVPAFIVCLLPGVIRTVRGHVRPSPDVRALLESIRRSTAPYVALCMLVSLAITSYFLLYRGIQGTGDLVQIYDNTFHLSVVKSMADSGEFSVLSVGAYLEPSAAAFDPSPGDAFYPAAWHILAALLSQMLSVPVTASVNLTNALFIGIVLPLGSLALLAEVTGRDRLVLLAGAFSPLLFVAFPWRLLYWGPLYPNLAAYCLVPGLVALFVSQTQESAGGIAERAPRLALFALGLATLVFVQTNAVFTLGVWVAPYCVYRLAATRFPSLESRTGLGRPVLRLLLAGGFVCFVVAAWAFFYTSSFMSSVVSYSDWEAFGGVTDAVWRIATLALRSPLPQYSLAVVVGVGIAYTLLHGRHLWLTAAAAAAAAFFAADVVSNGTIRHILTGFWYNDPYRIAAMVALFCIPLAAFGLAALARLAILVCGGRLRATGTLDPKEAAVSLFVVAAFSACVIWPYGDGSAIDTNRAFGKMLSALHDMYSIDYTNNSLTREEAEFVQEALEVLPDDAVVLNQPYDGSAFAYACYDMNLVYRKLNEVGGSTESPQSVVLRSKVDECATNEDVQEALDETGAEYLLLLDQDEKDKEDSYMPGFVEKDWVGIDAVRDDTPGFEVVLSEGDMRLYRIVV